MTDQTETPATDARIELLKLYVKDISMQIPEGAKAFQLEWQPELNFEINTQAKALAETNQRQSQTFWRARYSGKELRNGNQTCRSYNRCSRMSSSSLCRVG